MMVSNFITWHLQEFNREYLSSRADRRQALRNVVKGILTVAVIVAAGVVLFSG